MMADVGDGRRSAMTYWWSLLDLKTTGYQTYKRSEESQSITQIIRPAEESDLQMKNAKYSIK